MNMGIALTLEIDLYPATPGIERLSVLSWLRQNTKNLRKPRSGIKMLSLVQNRWYKKGIWIEKILNYL